MDFITLTAAFTFALLISNFLLLVTDYIAYKVMGYIIERKMKKAVKELEANKIADIKKEKTAKKSAQRKAQRAAKKEV